MIFKLFQPIEGLPPKHLSMGPATLRKNSFVKEYASKQFVEFIAENHAGVVKVVEENKSDYS